MLQEVLEYIHNYFVPMRAQLKEYTIHDNVITPDFGAEDGDRFLICGSRRNDGVYTWHADGIFDSIFDDDDNIAVGLQDETFAGTIRLMSVPPTIIRLSEEIKSWVATYGGQLNSPMQSESFNGYSYTLKSGGGLNGGNGPLTWRDQFGTQLEQWRKPCL